jgi:hypothetical protein
VPADNILTIGQEFTIKMIFSQSGDFKNSLDFSRLKTSSSGTLFAFIQFLLAHIGWEMKETSEKLANKER